MEGLTGTDDALTLVVGVALVLLGATGATLTQRRLDAEGRSVLALLALVPFGVLIGAGAALARGWELVISLVVGALLVPVVGGLGRLLEVRRLRKRRGPGAPDDLTGG
ncbi:MAG: hypothetical protein WD638_03575 [Nitriliruptoraceae bacterium]